MKFGIALACGSCFVLGVLFAQEAPARKPSTYTEGLYGFKLNAPEFAAAAEGASVTPVMLLGPAVDNFSPNINVIVQPKTTRDEFRTVTLEQLKAAGFTLSSEKNLKVSDSDAWRVEYEGATQGRSFHWLALAVFTPTRTLLVTGTELKDHWATTAPAFRASIDSFALTGE